MGWKKRNLVEKAYAELALAGYEFDLSPEEMDAGLQALDDMWATWDGMGIRAGYAMPSGPDDSDLDDESGLPAYAVETTAKNLAIRIAAGKGKALSPSTLRAASEGFTTLQRIAAYPRQQQLRSGVPRGAGGRIAPLYNPFLPDPKRDPLQVTQGGDLDIAQE